MGPGALRILVPWLLGTDLQFVMAFQEISSCLLRFFLILHLLPSVCISGLLRDRADQHPAISIPCESSSRKADCLRDSSVQLVSFERSAARGPCCFGFLPRSADCPDMPPQERGDFPRKELRLFSPGILQACIDSSLSIITGSTLQISIRALLSSGMASIVCVYDGPQYIRQP